MPRYGQKKPLDPKKSSQLIKRPVRKQGPPVKSSGFQPEVQIYTPDDNFENSDEEEENKGIMNDCNFNISPSRVPNSARRSNHR